LLEHRRFRHLVRWSRGVDAGLFIPENKARLAGGEPSVQRQPGPGGWLTGAAAGRLRHQECCHQSVKYGT
jgi:hypothetical protein